LKSFTATLLVLSALFYIACNMDSGLPEISQMTSRISEASHDTWRRTAQGWEKSTDWQHVPVISPEWIHAGSIHPALVASLQLLISLGALVAWNPAPRAR
jgi:hypothetical protein